MDVGEPAERMDSHEGAMPPGDGWLSCLWRKLVESSEAADESGVVVETRIAELERLIEDALRAADHEE